MAILTDVDASLMCLLKTDWKEKVISCQYLMVLKVFRLFPWPLYIITGQGLGSW